jgi:hypothetical protein
MKASVRHLLMTDSHTHFCLFKIDMNMCIKWFYILGETLLYCLALCSRVVLGPDKMNKCETCQSVKYCKMEKDLEKLPKPRIEKILGECRFYELDRRINPIR